MKQVGFQNQSYNLVLSLFIITIIRITILSQSNFALYADEAQYYGWSKDLALGYYSKPPMIAFLIRISCLIFGDSEFGIRVFAPILHFFTAIIIYHLAKKIYNQDVGYYASLVYISLPAVTLSSNLITTDPILLFFWAFTCLLFISEKWFLAGLTFGLGMLSKYNMMMFVISSAIYLYWQNKDFSWLKKSGIYFSLLVGVIIFAPNIYWNFKHDLVSFVHLKDISQIEKSNISFARLFEFLLTQVAMIGPVLSCLIFGLLKNFHSHKYVICLCIPTLLLISFLSLLSNAYGNWSAPAYVSFVIWCSAVTNQRKLKIAIIGNILIGIVFYGAIYFKEKLPVDPFKRLDGWKELGVKIKELSDIYPEALIISDDRKITALLIYYAGEENRDKIRIFHDKSEVKNHYDMTIPIDKIHKESILVLKYRIQPKEESCIYIKNFNNLNIYYCIK